FRHERGGFRHLANLGLDVELCCECGEEHLGILDLARELEGACRLAHGLVHVSAPEEDERANRPRGCLLVVRGCFALCDDRVCCNLPVPPPTAVEVLPDQPARDEADYPLIAEPLPRSSSLLSQLAIQPDIAGVEVLCPEVVVGDCDEVRAGGESELDRLLEV